MICVFCVPESSLLFVSRQPAQRKSVFSQRLKIKEEIIFKKETWNWRKDVLHCCKLCFWCCAVIVKFLFCLTVFLFFSEIQQKEKERLEQKEREQREKREKERSVTSCHFSRFGSCR